MLQRPKFAVPYCRPGTTQESKMPHFAMLKWLLLPEHWIFAISNEHAAKAKHSTTRPKHVAWCDCFLSTDLNLPVEDFLLAKRKRRRIIY